jgi:hypothetical protein
VGEEGGVGVVHSIISRALAPKLRLPYPSSADRLFRFTVYLDTRAVNLLSIICA